MRMTSSPELSTSSMADIAFLLLTFFLVTTQINVNKGLAVLLPEFSTKPLVAEWNERNVFAIHINSANQFLIEGEIKSDITGLRADIKDFVLNPNRSPHLSETPQLTVVSIRADRGSSYSSFIRALDESQAAYFEIYGARVGLMAAQFRQFDTEDPAQQKIYERAKLGLPMNISIAEPR